MKQKKKKGLGSEMRFGVNTATPFMGMKREEGIDYPFTKQVRWDMVANTILRMIYPQQYHFTMCMEWAFKPSTASFTNLHSRTWVSMQSITQGYGSPYRVVVFQTFLAPQLGGCESRTRHLRKDLDEMIPKPFFSDGVSELSSNAALKNVDTYAETRILTAYGVFAVANRRPPHPPGSSNCRLYTNDVRVWYCT